MSKQLDSNYAWWNPFKKKGTPKPETPKPQSPKPSTPKPVSKPTPAPVSKPARSGKYKLPYGTFKMPRPSEEYKANKKIENQAPKTREIGESDVDKDKYTKRYFKAKWGVDTMKERDAAKARFDKRQR